VHWKRDATGLWVEWDGGVFGFDLEGSRDDDKKLFFRARERGHHREWDGLRFIRDTEAATEGSTKKKKNLSVKAQMPGKVVKVLVAEGAMVMKDQPLLVLEAMKMENEIRAPHDGIVKKILVAAGTAVESGAVLLQVGQAGDET
jgi:acetyl/propionyl-CoA carboxylase alpha subunit